MTDTSSLIQNQIAVSNDVLYNLKPSAVRSSSYRCSIPTSNATTFVGGSTAILMVPCGRSNSYLDTTMSYLRFTVKNNDATAGNGFYTDGTGACFINRIDIFNSGALLESIQSYNQIFNYLVDFQILPSARQGLSAMYGTNRDINTIATGNNLRKGCPLWVTAAGVGQSMTFCIPLLSGVIGSLVDKMIPLHALVDDIRVEITFELNNTAVCYSAAANATTWTVTSMELELQILQLSDEGQQMVTSVTPFSDPVFIHGTSFRHYVSTVPASAGQISCLIPARFASLKAIQILPRRSNEIIGVNSYSLSSRVNFNAAQYWFRCGSAIIPSKYVQLISTTGNTAGYAEGYAEILKSFHSLNSTGLSSGITQDLFCVNDVSDLTIGGGLNNTIAGVIGLQGALNLTVNSHMNAFAIAQEFESFAQRSDILISGMNTLSQQIFFEANINTAPLSIYTLDIFAQYDHILIIQNGLLSVKF